MYSIHCPISRSQIFYPPKPARTAHLQYMRVSFHISLSDRSPIPDRNLLPPSPYSRIPAPHPHMPLPHRYHRTGILPGMPLHMRRMRYIHHSLLLSQIIPPCIFYSCSIPCSVKYIHYRMKFVPILSSFSGNPYASFPSAILFIRKVIFLASVRIICIPSPS